MDGAPPSPDTTHRMGVFTTNPRTVQDFHRANIPVWFVRDFNSAMEGFTNNVLSLVDARHFEGRIVTQKHSGFPCICNGKNDIADIVDMIHGYSRRWLTTSNPFDVGPLVTPASSSPPPVQVAEASSSSSRPAKRQKLSGNPTAKGKAQAKRPQDKGEAKVQRDPFATIASPFFPSAIPAWAAALQAVDQSTPPAMDPLPAYARKYCYPDPGLFANTPAQRRQQMLESWLRISDAWRASGNSHNGMKIQQWRDVLYIDYTSPVSTEGESTTHTAKRRAEALKILLPSGTTFREQKGVPFTWNGNRFSAGQSVPDDITREIMFDLYEQNFREDVLALDDLLYSPPPHIAGLAEERQRRGMPYELFPTIFSFGSYSPPNIGLSADNIRERLPFLMVFAKMMDAWPGEKPDIFRLGFRRQEISISKEQAHALEDAVARYYCQTFYNYFRRAPQIPHRLFSS
ncbi:hypothetical protein CVT24_013312 [Panaeolus cyanescens]|uniref:Uncharacterized protein n=1 Tax=Panaeolus cyanescens TaxID=181874 RepID=A0A409YMH0_9AGAR|nr:hypothetical protein CVT24_013312 [Panaeolus cyanescens]